MTNPNPQDAGAPGPETDDGNHTGGRVDVNERRVITHVSGGTVRISDGDPTNAAANMGGTIRNDASISGGTDAD